MKTGFWPAFCGFLLLILAVNLVFRRRARTLDDFFFAAGRLRAPLVALSLAAAWFGATSILVSTDEACRRGVSAFWLIGLPAVLTVLVLALLTGKAARLTALTLPGLAEVRYGRTVRHLVSGLLFWYLVVFAASQLVALGGFLAAFLRIPYLLGLTAGAVVVGLYASAGGLFSVVVTESLHFGLLLAGMAGLAVFLTGRSGLSDVAAAAARSGAGGYFDFLAGGWRNVLICLSFLLAWTISPVAWQRIRAARTVRASRAGLLAVVPVFILLYGLVVLIGLFSRPLLGADPDRGSVIPVLIATRTGPLLGALVFVAVVAAVVSTLDAAVNTGALTLARDIVPALRGGPKPTVVLSRVATVLTVAAAFLVATRFTSILKTIGLASEIMAEGLFLPGAAMFILKRKLPAAGLLSLVFGGGFALASFLSEAGVWSPGLPAWPFTLPAGFGLSAAGFGLGAAYEGLPSRTARRAGRP
jgi:SSS family solute:Na+ symporter